jgi:hypothetical protein
MATRLFYFFLCFSTFSVRAYSHALTERVIDETNQSLEFTNIVLLSLPGSTFIQGTISA